MQITNQLNKQLMLKLAAIISCVFCIAGAILHTTVALASLSAPAFNLGFQKGSRKSDFSSIYSVTVI
ncbi:MAG: hypothetical protein HOO93_14845 [Methyloglobulus sp.]|nr:hypothetical protein [Methyloglobulus sp.]